MGEAVNVGVAEGVNVRVAVGDGVGVLVRVGVGVGTSQHTSTQTLVVRAWSLLPTWCATPACMRLISAQVHSAPNAGFKHGGGPGVGAMRWQNR